MSDKFPAYVVRKSENSKISAQVEMLSQEDLPPGEVLIRVAYSSLNYKDALACTGHPGVARAFPHVPGIDCAGEVVTSDVDSFTPGDQVLVTGYDLGSVRWGGFAAYVRVPASWVVPLPKELNLEQAMIYGTAGFTAAQSVAAIVEHGATPQDGECVVSGATGGVGSFAVAILAKLGYHVVAVTGKESAHDYLKKLGAKEVIGRDDVFDTSGQPLLRSRWAAAVDTVGGETLSTILRSAKHRACITACGLVGGIDFNLTVYPFILRGVTLTGIDSAKCPYPRRLEMWQKLAGEWSVPNLETLVQTVDFNTLPAAVETILAGGVTGRILVKLVC